MIIKNTTIQNRSKQARLSSEHVIPSQNVRRADVVEFLKSLQQYSKSKEVILYSIGCYLLRNSSNPAVADFLNEFNYTPINIENIPEGEFDLLGSAYQFLNTKRENLERGSFYTGSNVAKDFVHDLDFGDGQVIFDPACGSGAFLYNSNAKADQIYGVDFDPVAIMIAKFNYFIKFPEANYPKLFCDDFFHWFSENSDQRFDYIIGNPPYGANLDLSKINSRYITSGESFSYFIESCFDLLKEDGILRFLVPEALLNVKRHTDIRDFILGEANLTRIKKYSEKFSGVMSDLYMIEINSDESHEVLFVDKTTTSIPTAVYKELRNHVFAHLTREDVAIIEKVNQRKEFDLSSSTFGLGVVTGDNKTKIFDEKIPGAEPIYTGKEVGRYNLFAPNKYLIFDRNNLQQVAPDEIYRAPEKLVYKTINKFLKVSIDTTGSLTTNSANIVIPKVPGLDIYIILAFLNSHLYSYLHLKLFGGVNKIAKENLMALPLPGLSSRDIEVIGELARKAIQDNDDLLLQDYINHRVFNLTESEVRHVKKHLPKSSDVSSYQMTLGNALV